MLITADGIWSVLVSIVRWLSAVLDSESVRAGLLILGFLLVCSVVFAVASWIDGVRQRRRYLPRRRRPKSSRAGIRLRRRCWSMVEGSGYEVHHERHPGDPAARRRHRECWSAICVNCGEQCRDGNGEVAHFSSAAQTASGIRERGWTVVTGNELCPTCSGFVTDVRRRELQEQGVS